MKTSKFTVEQIDYFPNGGDERGQGVGTAGFRSVAAEPARMLGWRDRFGRGPERSIRGAPSPDRRSTAP